MYRNEKRYESIYQLYNSNKNVISLAINTLIPQEKMILKKKYGEDYLGNGFLLNSEKNSCEMVERKLSKRIKEIEKLLENGKSQEEIIIYYQKLSSPSSIYKSFSNNQQEIKNFKLQKSFIENFPIQYHNIILKLLNKIDEKDKNLIQKFYFGKKYDILRNDIDYNELNNIYLLINRLRDEARKKFQHKPVKNDTQDIKMENVNQKIHEKSLEKKYENKELVENITINLVLKYTDDILNLIPFDENNVILNTIITNDKIIHQILNINKIVNCYINNLNNFKNAIEVIEIITSYRPDKIDDILLSPYFKKLTITEKECIYKKLHNLSDQKNYSKIYKLVK